MMGSPTMLAEQLLVFLRDVKEAPDDDIPRLILADWLQDHGDPRGEFIHLQVIRARLDGEDPRYPEVQQRERQILRRHALAWLGPLVEPAAEWRFCRGLISLEARGERLFTETFDALSADDVWLWVEELRLRDAQPDHLRRLADAPLLQHLCVLDLADSPLTRRGVRALAESPLLSGLRRLIVSSNPINRADLSALRERLGERLAMVPYP
jgi:uncharacterized protein (TIGR02996 family)